jgi:hypothetical protein
MRREVDPKRLPEKPLGYLLVVVFLSGYHLHNWQGKAQRPSLRFSLGKCPDRNSVARGKRIGNGFKLLSINADPLGLRITHPLELIANFVEFGGALAGGR